MKKERKVFFNGKDIDCIILEVWRNVGNNCLILKTKSENVFFSEQVFFDQYGKIIKTIGDIKEIHDLYYYHSLLERLGYKREI